MLANLPSVTQLAQIIAQVAAPSFLLGAVAAFIAVLVSRLNRVVDRAHSLNLTTGAEIARTHFRADIPLLVRRAAHLNRSIMLATISAIVTSLVVIVAFLSALLRLQHEYGVAVLFVVALGFFIASLVELVREVRLALHELDYFK